MAQMDTPGDSITPAPASAPTDERLFQSGVQRRTTVTVGEEADAGVLGRLHAARSVELDLPGLGRLVELARMHRTAQSWTIDGDAFVSFSGGSGGMRPLLHHGDLHVRGSLLIDEHAWLICTGNLRVDGIISDHRPSTLAVGGNVVAPRMVTTGNFYALGSVETSEVLLAREDASTFAIGGCLRSTLLLRHGRDLSMGSMDVAEYVDLADATHVAELHAQFAPDAFAPSGAVDLERCDRLLRCGLSVFGGA